MPVTTWKSLWEIRLPSIREEIDKIFEDFFGKAPLPLREESWMPALDIYERERDVVIFCDLPSVDPKEVTISIIGDKLTIKGERKRDEEFEQEYPYRLERFFGPFERTIQLPTDVVADKAKALYKDGVLRITIPKSERVGPKEIKVEVE